MHDNFAPRYLLCSVTLQYTNEPIIRLGLFFLVAPSNYSAGNIASNGAPISTV